MGAFNRSARLGVQTSGVNRHVRCPLTLLTAWPRHLGWALLKLNGLRLYDLTFVLIRFVNKAENRVARLMLNSGCQLSDRSRLQARVLCSTIQPFL